MIISSCSKKELKEFLNASSPYSTTLSYPFADVRANTDPEVNLETQYRLLFPALLPKSLNTDLQENRVEKYVFGVYNVQEINHRTHRIMFRVL